jgi:hypothetical protein
LVQNRHTFADSAYVTLVVAGEDLHYKDLAEKILEGGFFVSKGKTPAQTLRSQISREITTRGETARFVNRDHGMISLSEFARENPDEPLVEAVKAFSVVQLTKLAKRAKKAAAKAPEPVKVAEPVKAPEVIPESAPAKAAEVEVEVAPEEEAPPVVEAVAQETPAETPVEAAPEVPIEPSQAPEPDTFIPVDLDDGSFEDEFFTDGTFATAEHEVFLLEESEDEGEAVPTPSHFIEDDSEQDFLSVGPDLGEMTSSEYDASMEELAPIVVPPYEGGAAEIARLPLGGRTVLIVKVVRRNGQPQIQLVEELESLVSGAVGRLLLTLPGEDVNDLLGALLQVRKVISESFLGDQESLDPESLALL